MKKEVLHKLQHTFGITSDDKLLIAVSGGVDSMVLCHLLHTLNIKLAVAHCNFTLRGDESDGDELLVKAFCSENGIPFHCVSFDTLQIKKERKQSTQIVARELRYQWFEELINTHSYKYLCTAHHLNDSVESSLYNFAKGTGLKGIQGIPVINSYIIRPLMSITKEDILAYAKTNNVPYRNDSSNSENKYARNKIRNQVIPLLEEINPSFIKTQLKNKQLLTRQNQLLELTIKEKIKQYATYSSNGVKIELDSQEEFIDLILFEVLSTYHFPTDIHHDIISSWKAKKSGTLFYAPEHIATLNRNTVEISRNDISEFTYSIDELEFNISTPNGGLSSKKISTPKKLKTDKNTAVIDLSSCILPLTIRTWVAGDKFKPFGMNGKAQKLSNFLTGQKLSRIEKDKTQVLINGEGEIIWVIGYRTAESTRIQDDAKYVLKIILNNTNGK